MKIININILYSNREKERSVHGGWRVNDGETPSRNIVRSGDLDQRIA